MSEKFLTNNFESEQKPEATEAPENWVSTPDLKKRFNLKKTAFNGLVNRLIEKFPELESERGIFRNSETGKSFYFSPAIVELVEKNLTEDAPKDWTTQTAIIDRYDIDQSTVRKYAEQIIDESDGKLKAEENIKMFRSPSAGKSVIHYSPELVKLIEDKIKKLNQESPKDWVSFPSLLKEKPKLGRKAIEGIVDRLIEKTPELEKEKGVFTNENRMPTIYFSPKLIELIDENLVPEAPENWISMPSFLKEKIKFSRVAIERVINELIGNNPELEKETGMFRNPNGLKSLYYSPKLIELIDENLMPEAPENWIPALDLHEKLKIIKISRTGIDGVIERLIEKNPNLEKERGIFKNPKGGPVTYFYSPELIRLFEKDLILEAPENWMSLLNLKEKRKANSLTITKTVDRLIEKNSDLEKERGMFRNPKGGAMAYYYSPKLVELIDEKLTPEPPQGWVSLDNIAEETGLDKKKILKRLKGD